MPNPIKKLPKLQLKKGAYIRTNIYGLDIYNADYFSVQDVLLYKKEVARHISAMQKIVEGQDTEIKRLRTILSDIVNSGMPLQWTELYKYAESGENISLREVILNVLNRNPQYIKVSE